MSHNEEIAAWDRGRLTGEPASGPTPMKCPADGSDCPHMPINDNCPLKELIVAALRETPQID